MLRKEKTTSTKKKKKKIIQQKKKKEKEGIEKRSGLKNIEHGMLEISKYIYFFVMNSNLSYIQMKENM